MKSDESIPAVDKPIELTLNRELKVLAPPFVIPSESFQTLSKVKDKLSESRKAFIQVVDHAKRNDLEQKSFPHSLFKELGLKQWVTFVGLHEKRHLMQIEELKSKL
ncbi:DinB superfamily protein [Bacillus sp. OK838]|nr:DinB superfamily protein [Bacillus sp. OK838]